MITRSTKKLRRVVTSLLLDSMKELVAKFLMDLRWRQAHDVTVKSVNESGTAVNCSDHDAGQVIVLGKGCYFPVVRHRSRHTCDAEVCVGTVGRTCTANHEYHTARSEWTRSWSNGRSSSQRFHWKDQSAFQRDARRCLLSGIQLRTHGNTFTLNQQGSFFHTIEGWSKSADDM